MVEIPVNRWARLSEAAARLGIPPDVLRAEVERGTAGIRSQRLGARGLLFLAEPDVNAFAERLQQGGAR